VDLTKNTVLPAPFCEKSKETQQNCRRCNGVNDFRQNSESDSTIHSSLLLGDHPTSRNHSAQPSWRLS
jgi:hypothetical protein